MMTKSRLCEVREKGSHRTWRTIVLDMADDEEDEDEGGPVVSTRWDVIIPSIPVERFSFSSHCSTSRGGDEMAPEERNKMPS